MSKMPQPTSAKLSIKDKRDAVPKIQRLISKLEELNVDAIQSRDDAQIEALEKKIETLLVDIFSPTSIEFERYRDIIRLDTESIVFIGSISIDKIRKNIQQNKIRTTRILNDIIEGFQEDISDTAGGSPTNVLRAFSGLELHPRIADAANELYKDRHYTNAVEDSMKAIENYVKEKSGITDKIGEDLMMHAFSEKKPILALNSLQSDSDNNEQRGFKFLFAGAFVAIRNPRAHELMEDDPERALEYIALASLLAKLVDQSKKQ